MHHLSRALKKVKSRKNNPPFCAQSTHNAFLSMGRPRGIRGALIAQGRRQCARVMGHTRAPTTPLVFALVAIAKPAIAEDPFRRRRRRKYYDDKAKERQQESTSKAGKASGA